MLLKDNFRNKIIRLKIVTKAICNCCRRRIWLHTCTHPYKYYIKEELFIGTTLYYHPGSGTPQYCLQF